MFRFCLIALTLLSSFARADEYDIVIYGGTSAGVTAAIQARRMGKSVVLIEPGEHLGGLTSGGLGATDIGNKDAIGGLAREFYHRVWKHYEQPPAWRQESKEDYAKKRRAPGPDTMWTFEPHVAEKIFDDWVAEYQIPVVRRERLDLKNGVKKNGSQIATITMESGRTFSGKMFIDATYEGDLMAKAGVSYHVGRESNNVYNEMLNGVQIKNATKHQFNRPVDPHIVPGDPTGGLLPGLHDGPPGEEGAGDHRVQAYNFRICMSEAPDNRIPFPKPEGYDPLRYELLLRYIDAGVFDVFGNNQMMPNRKTDTNNNGGFSSDNIGMNYEYPDGDYETRERIFNEHVAYHQGLLYFLANDPRLPDDVKKYMSRWGLARDEFVKTGGWPHQLYVREARRMISDYVMTEHNCRWKSVAEDSVGLGAYNMDSHNVQRYVKDGKATNEGDIQVAVAAPYPISYRSIVPKAAECTNLFVPVCLSASHIAYGSIRMEPVFMVLGQSAATAASMTIDEGIAVQKVEYPKLRDRLLQDKQILAWKRTPRQQAK
jgi:FAD dependent oxidoreductase